MPSAITEAKKTAAIILRGYGFEFDGLSAKTVSFSDLARADCVFVKPRGLRIASVNGDAWNLAKAKAKEHGFRLEE